MSRRTKIALCPQHASGECAEPKYLLRTCPSCMGYLAKHPGAASLACHGIPGHRPWQPHGHGALDGIWSV